MKKFHLISVPFCCNFFPLHLTSCAADAIAIAAVRQLILLKTSRQIAYVTAKLIRKCLKWHSLSEPTLIHNNSNKQANISYGKSPTTAFTFFYVYMLQFDVHEPMFCSFFSLLSSSLPSHSVWFSFRSFERCFVGRFLWEKKKFFSWKWIPCAYSL